MGYHREEFIGKKFTDFVNIKDDGIADIDSWFSTVKSENTRESLPISLKNKMNKEKLFQCTLTYDDEKWYLTARNITKQKKAEMCVSVLQDKFEKITKATTDIIFEYDPTTEDLNWIDGLTDIMGYPAAVKHVDFDWWADKVHPDEVEEVFLSFSNVLRTEKMTWKASYRFKAFDGTYKYVLANMHIDRNEQGTPVYIIGALSDISDLRKSELRQKRLLSRLNHANHIAELGYWEINLDTGEVIWSDEIYRILHADKNNVIPSMKYILTLCESEDHEKLNNFINDLSQENGVGEIEHKISIQESGQKYLSHIGELVQEEGKSPIIIITTQDITDRKKREIEITKSLREKEVLLAEIHHRVKNNMAIISALLGLKLFQDIDKETEEFIKDSQSRIQTIAKIHEKLYQSDTFSHVSFKEYVVELIDTLRTSHKSEEVDVQFNANIDSVDLNINQAIPCGLIINELVTNALRHAFPYSKKGTVTVTVVSRDGQIHMTVEDDGVGLPAEFKIKGQQSLGMTLIETLSQQINAKLVIDNYEKGCKCSVVFDMKDKMRGAASSYL